MTDAFFLVEVMLDEREQPADVLFIEANPTRPPRAWPGSTGAVAG
jgi:hypothetical protein